MVISSRRKGEDVFKLTRRSKGLSFQHADPKERTLHG